MSHTLRMRTGILAFAMFTAASVISHAGVNPGPVTVGSKVGSFTLTDTKGKTHQITDFKGKIVVMEWVNPHCPVSVRTYDKEIMQPLQKTYTGKGVVWLLINSTNADHGDYEDADAMNSMYEEWKSAPTAISLDPDGTLGKMFEAKTTPHMFIIDPEQTLVYAGALDDDPRGNKTDKVNYITKALDELLAGSAVSTTSTQPYGCSVKYKK